MQSGTQIGNCIKLHFGPHIITQSLAFGASETLVSLSQSSSLGVIPIDFAAALQGILKSLKCNSNQVMRAACLLPIYLAHA